MSSVPRRPGNLVFALACLAGLAAAPVAARGGTAAPGQVVGYAKADRSGASQTWNLRPDKPYLYVPAIGAALGGRIAAVETGPEVGAVLFQGPYFTTRDRGCQPALGTTRRLGLRWLGATARFEPAPPGQDDEAPSEPSANANAADGGYGSLILYRADLGPPPGALLMDRRATLGRRCVNPLHNTVHNRIFVPVAEAPEAERCFDLVGNYPGASGTFPLDFVNSDRLVLLMPGDMADRYARVRHDITVILFDGLSCAGRSIALDSRARLGRDLRLNRVNFRDRARSLRLTYDYGNADAFLVRRETPLPAAPAATGLGLEQDRGLGQTPTAPVLSAQPIQDPTVGGAAPAPEPTSEPKRQAALPPTAAPVPATPLADKSAEPPAAPMVEAVPDRPTARSPVAAPTARTIPKLSPVMRSPDTQTAALPTASKTFTFPVHDLYRLNHCLHWRSDCGQPAAAAWCRAKGYAQALEWSVDKNIGTVFPTFVLGENRVCAQFACDGFKEITCGP